MIGPRKLHGRSGHPLRLVNTAWHARTPVRGDRDGRRGDRKGEAAAAVHDRALCNRERCRTCHDIEMAARGRKARQLWLRGRELCAAAALCRAAGRFLMAAHAIDQTCAILRRRADIREAEFGDD